MDIISSRVSFDDQCHNLNMFLLYPKLSMHLDKPGFKKYGDDKKIEYFKNSEKCMLLLPKVKANFSMIRNSFKTFKRK